MLLVLAGCQFKGAGVDAAGGAAGEVWRPRAESLRVYPSTRFVEQGGQTLLEARIELLDQMGDAIKSAGTARFDLFASDESGRALGQRLYEWRIALDTLQDQRNHFDSVTRTYRFRLRLDTEAPTEEPTVLRVTFQRAADGKRLAAQAPIRLE